MRAWTGEEIRRFVNVTRAPPMGAPSGCSWRRPACAVVKLLGLRVERRRSRGGLDHHHPFHPHSLRQDRTTTDAKTARGNRTIAIGPTTVGRIASVEADTDDRAAADRRRMARRPRPRGHQRRRRRPEPRGVLKPVRQVGPSGRATADPPARPPAQLRHRCAAAGVPVKVLRSASVTPMSGSRSPSTHVMPGDDEDAARRADALFAEP